MTGTSQTNTVSLVVHDGTSRDPAAAMRAWPLQSTSLLPYKIVGGTNKGVRLSAAAGAPHAPESNCAPNSPHFSASLHRAPVTLGFGPTKLPCFAYTSDAGRVG